MSKINKKPMTEEFFNQRKKELLAMGYNSLNNPLFSSEEKELVNDLLNILNRYTYENRLESKRFLTHIVSDRCILLNDPFVEAVCDFDYNIR